MRILVSGSSGLIGRALVQSLGGRGDEVVRLVRGQPEPGTAAVSWDPAGSRLSSGDMEGFDAVVHLAGENIAAGRWTPAKKARIRTSRVAGTRLLGETLARLSRPPGVFASASAVGYYGNRGDAPVDESSPPGTGFLAEVCRDWEAAARAAVAPGIRTVQLRFGVVLTPRDGALGKMLPAFRLGLGGRLGNGRQYMSWITLDDAVGAIEHVLAASLSGPVNVVAPQAVTNREFTATLGRVLHRPALLPLPGFALRALLGEMAGELLGGARVAPQRLSESGYPFRDPELEPALRRLLSP